MKLVGLRWEQRLIADDVCEHGVPYTEECPECYRIYEAEEGTRQ